MIARNMLFQLSKILKPSSSMKGVTKSYLLLNHFLSSARRGGVSLPGGALHSMRCIVEMDAFLSNKDEDSSVVAIGGPR